MNPTNDQLLKFFVKSIGAKYGEIGLDPLKKLSDSYEDLLLYEYLMRPHNMDGKLNSIYQIITESLSNHETASIIRYENGGVPIYKVKPVNNSEPPILGFGMLLTHRLIKKEMDHSQVINKCKNLLLQNPKDTEDVFDVAYWDFIKAVAKENQMPLDNDNDYFKKLIPRAASFIKEEQNIPSFDLIYVGTLMYLFLRQSRYLVDYLFFWNSNVEYWLSHKVKGASSVNIASLFLQVYQNHY